MRIISFLWITMRSINTYLNQDEDAVTVNTVDFNSGRKQISRNSS